MPKKIAPALKELRHGIADRHQRRVSLSPDPGEHEDAAMLIGRELRAGHHVTGDELKDGLLRIEPPQAHVEPRVLARQPKHASGITLRPIEAKTATVTMPRGSWCEAASSVSARSIAASTASVLRTNSSPAV